MKFSLNFSSLVAKRMIISGHKDLFFASIAILSIAGVAIGVATMIVVLSVINGFETELKSRFLNANAHILLFRYPDGLTNPNEWQQRITKAFPNELIGASPFVHYETMVRKGSLMHSVLVRGFDPAVREKVQSVRRWIDPPTALDILSKESHPPAPAQYSVIVGQGLMSILDLKIGDSIDLIAPGENSEQKTGRFTVEGVYRSGLKHYDNRLIAMSLTAAQNFFGMGKRVTGLELGMKDPYQSPKLASKILDRFPISVKEWQSFNRPLLEALNMERAVIFLMVCVVAMVAGLNILTTLFVGVTQKQRNISILKALGASNRQIIEIFLKQGAILGILGSTIGVALAYAISWTIETYQFIELPDPYYLTKLPVDYDYKVYLILAGVGVIICIVAGIFPSYMASTVSPTKGIKGINNKGVV